MGFLDELKRLTHPYEDDMEDDYDLSLIHI